RLLAAARACLAPSLVNTSLVALRRWRVAPSGFRRLDALRAFLDATEWGISGKLLVFAGFPGLAGRLADRLREQLGPAVLEFRGEMDRTEKEANVTRFRTDPLVRVLVCDETGGEGRNFQFADSVVHFDNPWYVSRVEQRIGRLDRLGRQEPEVVSHVFFCPGTPEGNLVRC